MRTITAGILFVTLLAIAALLHLGIGARFIDPRDVLSALTAYDPRRFDHQVIVNLRLLRLLCAITTGAALGVAGVLLQAVIRNPLGEPHILGINAGGSLLVVLTSALGMTLPIERPLIAALGAAGLFSLVLLFAQGGRTGMTPMKVTLCGVALSAFASAITGAILLFDEQTLQAMRLWLSGDLAGGSWEVLGAAVGVGVVGLGIALWVSPALSILALGDKTAAGLGIAIVRTRILTMGAIALLCGAALSVAGPIGFIGLVVPQVIRRLVSQDIRVMLPFSACCGALLMVLADSLARTLFSPHELATGIMTALVGAPLFIFMAARFFK